MIPLVLLGIPPILLYTHAGIRGVDPAAVDAARGLGMTPWQTVWQVEVPAAMPLILAGLRGAAVQIVATATLAAVVSFGGFGRYIIDGLYQFDYEQVVGGAVLVAGLSLVTLLVFWLLDRLLVSPGLRVQVRTPGTASSTPSQGATPCQARHLMPFRRPCGRSTWPRARWPAAAVRRRPTRAAPTRSRGRRRQARWSSARTTSPSPILLADIYGQALADKGIKVSYKLNIGSREVTYGLVKSGATPGSRSTTARCSTTWTRTPAQTSAERGGLGDHRGTCPPASRSSTRRRHRTTTR